MLKRSGVEVVVHKGRIQAVLAGLTLVALMISLSAQAKSRQPQKLFFNDSPQSARIRESLLNYPTIPKEIYERARGARKQQPATASKYDSKLSLDWALSSIGFFEAFTPLIQPIRAEVSPCSNSVVVAVIDTGVDYTHPELRDNMWVNTKEIPDNGIDDDGNGLVDDYIGYDFVNNVSKPFDVHGHGTHISGIIAAKPSNGVGLVGVCPNVQIMALKYYDNSALGVNNLTNTVKAFEYAIKMGAHIINYSGGGSDSAESERQMVQLAQKKGILVVAAAGNDGHNNDIIPYYPASYPVDNVVSVASISPEQDLLPSSNWGTKVHIAAPGYAILSAMPGGKFGTMSGTSQATAFVTGAAALLASQLPSIEDFDYRKIKGWLIQGAKPFRPSDGKKVLSGVLSVNSAIRVTKESIQKPENNAPELALRPGSPRTPITQ